MATNRYTRTRQNQGNATSGWNDGGMSGQRYGSNMPAQRYGSNMPGQQYRGSQQKLDLEMVFEEGVKMMYDAEIQLLGALPKMAQAAQNEELREAFELHEQETREQVSRLERVMDQLGISTAGVERCIAMQGLISEGNKIIQKYIQGSARDAALIAAAQKVEHYEIASYGTLCELADLLDHGDAKDLLGDSLEEEEDTDEKLTDIADDVNDEALELVEGREDYSERSWW